MYKRRNILWVMTVIFVAILTSTLTVVVMAATSLNPISGDGVISAAYQKVNGMLRLINGPADVNPSETYLSWNQKGPAGPQGPTGPTGATGAPGATGATGNFTGMFTGNTTFTGSSNNFTGNISIGSNFIKLGTGSSVYEQSAGIVAFRNNTNTGYVEVKNKFNFLDSLSTTDYLNAVFKTATDANVNNRIIFQAYNGSALQTIARMWGGNGTQSYFELTLAPKFAIQNVAGPANNVTPVTWIPVLLADNTTGYMPVYK